MIDIGASLDARYRQNAEGCVKISEDLSRYRRIIAETKPERIIECGTFSGKSALWLAREAQCQVVTIDTNPCVDEYTREAWEDYNIVQITRSSIDPQTILTMYRIATDGLRTMVVLDSDHSTAHVLAEMTAYAPLVTSGCFMVVEDTLLRHMPDDERAVYDGDPLEAVQLWGTRQSTEWCLNSAVEYMSPITQHPNGFWKRSP